MRIIRLIIKRLFDLIASFVSIIVLSPIFLIVAIAIKIDSKGPAIFKQARIGRKGKTFNIYKFRTMVINAENIGDGLSINSSKDPRITRIGSFLRKTSLDELPQLINVLFGKMSIVGPRPPVTYFPYDGYGNYPDEFKNRFLMRPGITGYSQVLQRNNTTWEKRILTDLEYINNFTLIFDVKIIFKTILAVFKKEDIYNEK